MKNEMEEINKETGDEFMLVTTQAISLLSGHTDFLEEVASKSWNIFYSISLLGKQVRNSGRIISMCKLQQLHLKEVAKLHNKSAEDWRNYGIYSRTNG